MPGPYDALTADGLRTSNHGVLYQQKLLTLAAERAKHNPAVHDFYVISEAKAFEKFDDLVVDYGGSITFLQAKHGAPNHLGQVPAYSKSDFLSKDDDASLAKYFDSWLRLKRGQFAKHPDGQDKPAQFIFFSNKKVAQDIAGYLTPCQLESDAFLFENIASNTFIFNPNLDLSEFISAIEAQSEEVKAAATQQPHPAAAPYTHADLVAAINELKTKAKNDQGKVFAPQEKPKRSTQKGSAGFAAALRELQSLHQRQQLVAFLQQYQVSEVEMTRINDWLTRVNYVVTIKADARYAGILNDQIKLFLRNFVIKIAQPSLNKLDAILERELGIDVHLGQAEYHDALNRYIQTWFAERYQCVLTSENFEREAEAISADLTRYYLLGNTQRFESVAQAVCHHLVLPELPEVRTLLEQTIPYHHTVCLVEPTPHLGVTYRLYQTLTNYKQQHSLKDAAWHYMTPQHPCFDGLTQIFMGRSTRLFILDLRSAQINDAMLSYVATLSNIASTHKKQLVVCLSQTGYAHDLVNQLRLLRPEDPNPDLGVQTHTIEPLTQDALQLACQPHLDETLIAGGRNLPLSAVISAPESGLYKQLTQLEVLHDVLAHTHANPLTPCSHLPYDVYIPNPLIPGIPIYKLVGLLKFNVQPGLRIVGFESAEDANKLKTLLDRFIESEIAANGTKAPFLYRAVIADQIPDALPCLIVTTGEATDHLPPNLIEFECVDMTADTLASIEVQLTTRHPDINLPTPTRYVFPDETTENHANDVMHATHRAHLCVLASQAGHGKSALSQHHQYRWALYDQTITHSSPAHWVIRVNLPYTLFDTDQPSFESALTQIGTDVEWPNWARAALEHDMHFPGYVRFYLDGFDEVKDPTQIERINAWLSTLPPTCDVFIMTRPYAAHKVKLPQGHQLSHYYALKRYLPNQRVEYTTQYLTAIFNEVATAAAPPPAPTLIQALATRIVDCLVSRTQDEKIVSLLGIPLESYLFCESLKADLISAWDAQSHATQIDIDETLEQLGTLTMAGLYQRFVRTKLQLFLVKHMGMSLTSTLRSTDHLYSFTTGYTELLMVFAYVQAFKDTSTTLDTRLSHLSFSNEMLTELADSGVGVYVPSDTQPMFKFNHETYQAYFACLYLLKQLTHPVSSPEYQHAQRMIQDHCYKPGFRNHMMLMAQLSLSGDPLIPSWSRNVSAHTPAFWEALCRGEDYLGIGMTTLLKACISVLRPDEKMTLSSLLHDKPWANQLLFILNDQQPFTATPHTEIPPVDDVTVETNLPVVPHANLLAPTALSQEAYTTLRANLFDKNNALTATKEALASGVPMILLRDLFIEVLEAHLKTGLTSMDYWDCNGGFAAIALVGDTLNLRLAQALCQLVDLQSTLYASGVLTIARRSISPHTDETSKHAVTHILSHYLTRYAAVAMKRRALNFLPEVLGSIQQDPAFIFSALFEKLQDSLQIDAIVGRLPSGTHIYFESCFSDPVGYLCNILEMAYMLKYALFFHETPTLSMTLSGPTHLTIEFETCPPHTRALITTFFAALRATDVYAREDFLLLDKTKICESLKATYPNDILEPLYDTLYQQVYQRLVSESFSPVFSGHTGYDLDDFKAYHVLDHQFAHALTLEVEKDHAQTRNNYWSRNTGIGLVKYVGHYFNTTLATYLIHRANCSPDNHVQVCKTLKALHQALSAYPTHLRNAQFNTAVQCYNACINDPVFTHDPLPRLNLNTRIGRSNSTPGLFQLPRQQPADTVTPPAIPSPSNTQ